MLLLSKCSFTKSVQFLQEIDVFLDTSGICMLMKNNT